VALQSLKDLGCLIYRKFLELFRHMVGLLGEWSARRKASTYTGQHNTERRRQTSMPWAGLEPTIPTTNRPRPTPQTARPLWPACILDYGLESKCSQLWLKWHTRFVCELYTDLIAQSIFLCQSIYLLANARFSAFKLYYEEVNLHYILNLII
jgi:hypothetical protein